MADLAGGLIIENEFASGSPQNRLLGTLSSIVPFCYSSPNDRLASNATFTPRAIYLIRAWRTESAAYVTWTGETPSTPYSGGGTLLGTAVIQIKTT